MKRTIGLVLLLAAVASGANDFTGDANCVALWRFESGALTTDSIGGNTLNTSGSPIASATCMEGAASVDLEKGDADYVYKTDVTLSSDFPFKGGTTNTSISLCVWLNLESAGSSTNQRPFFSKFWNGSPDGSSLLLELDDSNTFIGACSDGSALQWIGLGVTPSLAVWYHFAFTYDGASKAWKSRIYNNNTQAVTDSNGTLTNAIWINDTNLEIGKTGFLSRYWDGLMDEYVIFNDVLTTDEIDQIRGGTYESAAETVYHRGWLREAIRQRR